jgi:hypothetical protein
MEGAERSGVKKANEKTQPEATAAQPAIFEVAIMTFSSLFKMSVTGT